MGRGEPRASNRRAACDPGPVPFLGSPGPGVPQVQPLPAPPTHSLPAGPPGTPGLLDFSAALHGDDTAHSATDGSPHLGDTPASAPAGAAYTGPPPLPLPAPRDRRGVRLGSTCPVLSGGDPCSRAQGGPGEVPGGSSRPGHRAVWASAPCGAWRRGWSVPR